MAVKEYRLRELCNVLFVAWTLHRCTSDPDPCRGASCPEGTVCKLVEVCAPLCAVVSVCATPVPVDLVRNPCNEGTPLIDTSGKEKVCVVRGSPCPGALNCVADGMSGQGRCCPTGGLLTKRATKRGRCPDRPSYGICFNFCSNDMDCQDGQKCCSNGCGNACSSPTGVIPRSHSNIANRFPVASSSPIVTEGTCPEVTMFGDCIRTCDSDMDCKKGLKCCSNGCGQTCQNPVLPPKVGTCPKDFSDGPCMTRYRCESDSNCPGRDKCCSTNCGRRCRDPHSSPIPRPGVCPTSSLSLGAKFSCSVRFDLCQFDVECPGDMKCCKTECGNKCKTALSNMPVGKSGQCPAPEDNENGEGSSLCLSFCRGDDDCPMTQKCCLRGDRCSYICTTPLS